ncbi:Uncharacterized protein FWK35_00014365 [Aphis craccivora]|uniref:Uncharacterized protein n=1 Tax=Aphis craccivora TaxID=307492 RepID=A0A6G0YQY7_APHCR|nr:Uncharacterized protein FWK35_00014365 [Aphis craccivora]
MLYRNEYNHLMKRIISDIQQIFDGHLNTHTTSYKFDVVITSVAKYITGYIIAMKNLSLSKSLVYNIFIHTTSLSTRYTLIFIPTYNDDDGDDGSALFWILDIVEYSIPHHCCNGTDVLLPGVVDTIFHGVISFRRIKLNPLQKSHVTKSKNGQSTRELVTGQLLPIHLIDFLYVLFNSLNPSKVQYVLDTSIKPLLNISIILFRRSKESRPNHTQKHFIKQGNLILVLYQYSGVKHSERSDVCIDFTMMCVLTSQNNAPISNFWGGFRCKSEYSWCIIEVKIKHFPTVPYEFSNLYEICRKRENLQRNVTIYPQMISIFFIIQKFLINYSYIQILTKIHQNHEYLQFIFGIISPTNLLLFLNSGSAAVTTLLNIDSKMWNNG